MKATIVGACLDVIETKLRSVTGFFTEAERKVYAELIRGWEDFDGERAVRAWAYQSGPRADFASLRDTYLRFREERAERARGQEEAAPDLTRRGYEQQRAGNTPYALMREGFLRKWGQLHPGEDIPPEWDRVFRTLDARKAGTDADVKIAVPKATTTPVAPLPAANDPRVVRLVRMGYGVENARRVARWQRKEEDGDTDREG